MRYEYDVAVVGGGTAGLVAAGVAQSVGAKTVLIEQARVGGECLWTGCVPSKTLIKSAKVWNTIQGAEEFGVHLEKPSLRWNAVKLRIAAVRDEIRANEQAQIRELGLETRRGTAQFVDSHTLRIMSADGESTIRARRIILAAGTKSRSPEIAGLEKYLTYADIYTLPSLPRRLVILGGGPVACEFAQAFARMGCKVTILQRNARVLPREDEDVSAEALRILRNAGVDVRLNSTVLRAGHEGEETWLQLADETLRTTHVLAATGKTCDLSGLNVEAAGVRWGEGGVEVDAYLRAAKTVWACGDVTGAPYFTHRAEYQGRIAAQNALLPIRAKTNDRALPRVTFLDPEIAAVGETETANTRAWKITFASLDRAIIEGETEGFCKIVTGRSGRIVGASVVGAHAGEIIALLAGCVRDGVLVQELGEAVFAYPTMSEIAHRAGQMYFTELLKRPLVQRVARRIMRR